MQNPLASFFEDNPQETKASLAQKIGVARSTMTLWCNGSRRPSPEKARDLAVATGNRDLIAFWYPELAEALAPLTPDPQEGQAHG